MPDFIKDHALLVCLILFGATSHGLAQVSQSRRSNETFDAIDFVIAIVISAFSGTIFGIMATYLWSDPLVIHALAGTGAFLGLKGLNSVTDALIQLLITRTGKGGIHEPKS